MRTNYVRSIPPPKASLKRSRKRPRIESLAIEKNPARFPSSFFMRNHHRGCEGRARKRALFEVAKSGIAHPPAYLIEAEVAPLRRQQKVEREHRSCRRLRQRAIHDVILHDQHPARIERRETFLHQRGIGLFVLAMN